MHLPIKIRGARARDKARPTLHLIIDCRGSQRPATTELEIKPVAL